MRSLAFAFVFWFGVFAQANDTAVTVASGGIRFVKADKIRLQSEKLTIATDKITVRYQFLNTDSKDQELKVAFPLPEIDGENISTFGSDEMYRLYTYLEGNGGEGYFGSMKRYFEGGVAISDFILKVDGRGRSYNYRYSALGLDGKDLTRLLQENDVPLSVSYLNGWEEEGALVRNPKLKERVQKLKLLTSNGRAAWKNQMTYFWTDTFPAKKKHLVEHEYSPAAGSNWVRSEGKARTISEVRMADGTWEWKDYCPSAELEKRLLNAQAKHEAKVDEKTMGIQREAYPRVREVRYILTTANHWEGSIGQFELEVIPPSKDTLVSFCWPTPYRQEKDGRIRITEKDFSPKQDLRVLFLEPHRLVVGNH